MEYRGGLFHPKDYGSSLPECSFHVLLVNTHYPNEHLVVLKGCSCWNCRRCGPKLKAKYEKHILSARVALEVIDPGPGGYDMWKRRLQRAGAKYAQLKMDDGRRLIITQAQGMGDPIDTTQFHELIRGVAFERRAIVMSHSWSLKKSGHPRHGDRASGNSEWRYAGRAREPDVIQQELERLGVEVNADSEFLSFRLEDCHMGLLRYSVIMHRIMEAKDRT